MRREEQDRKLVASFEYLRRQAESGDEFTVQDLSDASGWTIRNARTNVSKRLRDFLRRVGTGRYRCDPVILRVALDEYASLFRQSNRLFATYTPSFYGDVIVYEFFLPLSHEQRLRDALDNLFYRDRLERTLREIGVREIEQAFRRVGQETDDQIIQRVIDRAEDVFGGYSISHVNGRFRGANLMSVRDAATYEAAGNRYLVDETTAVVRFIAPCPSTRWGPGEQPRLPEDDDGVAREAYETRWLFVNVFAQALLRMVKQEEEVWLLESGAQSGLYVWRRVDD